jgi:hypothetical protein
MTSEELPTHFSICNAQFRMIHNGVACRRSTMVLSYLVMECVLGETL